MAESGGAVAVGWDGEVVDMVEEGTVGCDVGEALKVDAYGGAVVVGVGGDGDGACN